MDNTTTMTQGLSIHWDKPRWTPGRILMWVLCLAPSAWFVLFGLFVLRAMLAYGQLPSIDSPDPKELGFTPHYYATIIAFVMAFFAPFGIALVILLRRWVNLHGARLPIIIFLVTFVAMMLFLSSSLYRPLGIWWMD